MAKLYGLAGKVTGKKGDMVFQVRNGQQLIRQYNPIVANPRTVAQTENRIKMKLMSQLAAIYAPVIAIPREGAKSPRNIFSSLNYGFMSVADMKGEADMVKLQLTKSTRPMPAFVAQRSGSDSISVALAADSAGQVDSVIYVLVTIDGDNNIRVIGSAQASEATADGTYPATLPYTADAAVVYAYGLTNISGKAQVRFNNVQGDPAEYVAELFVTRQLTMSDASLTETKGVSLARVV